MPTHTTAARTSEQVAYESRKKVLELVYKAQTSHIGSLFGAAEIFASVFKDFQWQKDIFVLSAGWKAAMLYFHLWMAGRITSEQLDSYCMEGSRFIGLAEPFHDDIPVAGGSMGLGLPAAVGIALGKKLKGEDGRVFVLMSDGEIQCGTTWEAAVIAAKHQLDNLVVLVDANGWQAMGETEEIMGLNEDDIDQFFERAGFLTTVVNGHWCSAIEMAISPKERTEKQPRAVTCVTLKGRGVPFMEDNNLYHYKQLSKEEFEEAKKALVWEK